MAVNQRNRQPSSFKHQIINSSFFITFNKYWNGLPRWHQRGLMVLIPIVLVLLCLPVSHSEPDVAKSTNKARNPQRVSVPVMINGVETSASKPQPKINDNKDERRISLGGNTDDVKSESKTKPTVSDNAGPEPWHSYTVEEGDTLSQVFRNNDLSLSDLNQLVAIEGKDKPLSQIKNGQLVRFKLTNRGDLDILQIEKEASTVLFFRLSSGGFERGQ